MASAGFRFGKWNFWFHITENEARKACIPAIFIASTTVYIGLSAILIYNKFKAITDSKSMVQKHKFEFDMTKLKSEVEKEVCAQKHQHVIETIRQKAQLNKESYSAKKTDDILYKMAINSMRREQSEQSGERDEYNENDYAKPIMRNASDIPTVDGHYDDHQLCGKLAYREDICLFYGEEHIAKTSITLCIMMDLVLRRKSCLIDENKDNFPPYTCLWYNAEMNEADFQTFFGEFDRHRLDGRLLFIENFSHMTLREWLQDVKKQLMGCKTDTVVVLDNISCICNSTDAEVRDLINMVKSIQSHTQERGIYTTFIIIDHINKQGKVAGTYKLNALFSNRIRFSSHGDGHTAIKVEKNRAYHDMVNHSYDLHWITSIEGNKSFENLGEIFEDSMPAQTVEDEKSPDDCGKVWTDEKILEFHEVLRETRNKSEAERRTGVPRQRYDRRIKKLLADGECDPIV